MTSRRPIGLTLLSLAFLGLTIATFQNVWRFLEDPSPLVRLGVDPRAARNVAVFAGACAAWATIAAWFRNRTLPWAITAWGLGVGAVMIEVQKGMGTQGEPLWLVAFPYLVLALLVWLLVAFAAGRVP